MHDQFTACKIIMKLLHISSQLTQISENNVIRIRNTSCTVKINSPTPPVATNTKENQEILTMAIFCWSVSTFWNFYLNKACCKKDLPYLYELLYYKVASLCWPSVIFTCSLVWHTSFSLFLCWLMWIKTFSLNSSVRQLLLPQGPSNTFFKSYNNT